MFETIAEKWNDILNFMREAYDLNDLSYKTWLEPMKLYKLHENRLFIIAHEEDERIISIISKKYKDYISVAIEQVANCKVDVILITRKESENLVLEEINSQENVSDSNIILNNHLNPKYTFDSFVSGKSNEFAHAASLAVAESPGTVYKLLYIYGGVGLGKTHLMHAVAIHVLRNNPLAKVLYVTSETFTNEYIESIRKNTTEEFRNKYRNLDMLMVDDIQFLADKAGTQEEFFNTFNALYAQDKQIIISSDKPPKDINNLAERIRSRFEGGLIVDIEPPNFETRMAILRKKEEIEGYNIDDEVIKYIATNIKSNIRQLEGALSRIVLKSKLEKMPITVETAQDILKDIIEPDSAPEKLTPQRIVSVVAEHYHISEQDIISAKRNKELTHPRQVCMYLCCTLAGITLQTVGEILGGRDHSTIIHGRDKITADISENEELKSEIEVIIKKLNS